MLAGRKAQIRPVAVADGQHALVGGDALEQAGHLLGFVSGQQPAHLIADGIEHEPGAQLHVAARPLFHERCRKRQDGQNDDGRHEHCDAAKAEDDPQSACFLTKANTFVRSSDQRLGGCPELRPDGMPRENAALAPVMGFRAELSRLR
jgi:hypothetical protein